MPESLLDAVTAGDVDHVRKLLATALMRAAHAGNLDLVKTLIDAEVDVLARNGGGLTAPMMVEERHYIDVIDLLHEAEREAGVGEGSGWTKNAPGSRVVTFLKPRK
jgi:uncharacterized protein